ncbi:hypothetical protein AB0903_09140 [Streptomyces sp. NPDC048389]|uniref:hypothetical protein n=1 Tax=Streptomyces sp. NPDC048389 TaxID=3154622 RepID=UPI0034533E8E
MNCPTCRRSLHPDETHRTACVRCENRLRAWLREIPLQRPLLEASLHIGAAPATGRLGGTGRAHAPLPLREDVLTLLGPAAPGTVHDPHHDQTGPTPIHAVLYAWADRLADQLGHALPALRPGDDYSYYVLANLRHVVTRAWVTDMYAELRDLIHRIRAVTRTEPQRRVQEAPCPSCRAFALFEEDWQTYLDCEACGLLLTPAEYRAHHAAVMPTLYRIGVLMAAATAEETPPS